MALQQDLVVDQGTLFEWDFFVRTDQTTIFGLTDWQVRGQVRKTVDSTAVLITPMFDTSTILGRITMIINPLDTETITFSGDELECVYDIEIFNALTGDVKRIVSGGLTLTKEVTREVV